MDMIRHFLGSNYDPPILFQITESSSEVVPKMESADSVAEEGVSDLQKEIDNVITGTLTTLLQVH